MVTAAGTFAGGPDSGTTGALNLVAAQPIRSCEGRCADTIGSPRPGLAGGASRRVGIQT